jgi:predicted Zn finger-like uncharacterized protein
MLTRCPHCRSLFRITSEQLALAKGTARCGHCNTLFYAARKQQTPSALQPWPTAQEWLKHPQTEPFHPSKSTPSGAGARLAWGSAGLLLGLSLLAQFAWWDREALSNTPLGEKIAQRLCAHLPCHLQPPRAPDSIVVLQRELDLMETPPNALRLRFLMENQHQRAQVYPLIELSLLDRSGSLLGKRRFAAEQYLPQSVAHTDRFPVRQPLWLSFELAPNHPAVAGYQIDFF